MDQRVSDTHFRDASPVNPADHELSTWAPPKATLVMPKQVVEAPARWADLAILGRVFLPHRKV